MANTEDKLQFRMVAYTDAAGKYNNDTYRCGNEDNFYVDDDLADGILDHLQADQTLPLGPKGLLMVVADGMGGMNAGEVASEMAINVVREYFAPEQITEEIASTHKQRSAYMESVIKDADKRIKADSTTNPEHAGMGTTMILAWLYQNELSISWCGDSRAYLFHKERGVTLLSEDHSYVQELVNKGFITYEQTFDHPQNNIITRSVGDPNNDAKPESRLFQVGKGDIILLCSDGLSGVLRDKKIQDENGHYIDEPNLEDILLTHTYSMQACREALWKAAEAAGWYDNVTAILCQITEGGEAVAPVSTNAQTQKSFLKRITSVKVLCIILAIFLVAGGLGWAFMKFIPHGDGWCLGGSNDSILVNSVDSVQEEYMEGPAVGQEADDDEEETEEEELPKSGVPAPSLVATSEKPKTGAGAKDESVDDALTEIKSSDTTKVNTKKKE